jgi:hypothetical protein
MKEKLAVTVVVIHANNNKKTNSGRIITRIKLKFETKEF